jgi:hypothetical protein
MEIEPHDRIPIALAHLRDLAAAASESVITLPPRAVVTGGKTAGRVEYGELV